MGTRHHLQTPSVICKQNKTISYKTENAACLIYESAKYTELQPLRAATTDTVAASTICFGISPCQFSPPCLQPACLSVFGLTCCLDWFACPWTNLLTLNWLFSVRFFLCFCQQQPCVLFAFFCISACEALILLLIELMPCSA